MAEHPAPHVTAIVPVLNDAETLGDAVGSILSQEYGGRLDVVIAVGPSADDSMAAATDLAKRHPEVRVIANPPGGTAAGLNRAIQVAEGDVIARVDAHARLTPGYLQLAVRLLDALDADNVGGMQVAVGRSGSERAIALAMSSPFGSGDSRFRVGGEAGPVDSVYLGVFRREALERVGGFDESLVRNQDYELNVRLRASGGLVYFDPRLRVEYLPRDGLRSIARQYFEYGVWKVVVLRRHPASLRMRQVIPPMVVAANVLGVAVAFAGKRRALLIPGLYLVGDLAASLLAGRQQPWSVRCRLPLTFATMHHSWGAGFLTALCGIRGREESRSARVAGTL